MIQGGLTQKDSVEYMEGSISSFRCSALFDRFAPPLLGCGASSDDKEKARCTLTHTPSSRSVDVLGSEYLLIHELKLPCAAESTRRPAPLGVDSLDTAIFGQERIPGYPTSISSIKSRLVRILNVGRLQAYTGNFK